MATTRRSALTPLAIEVLGLLHEHPMHPYEMQQLMRERRADLRVKIKAGSLYHTVERLATNGEIEVVDTEREGRRPERTVYAITDSGRDAFSTRVGEILSTPADEQPEYLIGLSAANDISYDETLSALKLRVMQLEAKIAANRAITDRLAEMKLPEMYWIDYQFVISQQTAELEWTRSLVERLESGAIEWPNDSWTFPNLSVVNPEGKSA